MALALYLRDIRKNWTINPGELTMTLEEKQQFLIENGIATEEEIRLVTCINGWNDESLDDIYYAREGEHFDD